VLVRLHRLAALPAGLDLGVDICQARLELPLGVEPGHDDVPALVPVRVVAVAAYHPSAAQPVLEVQSLRPARPRSRQPGRSLWTRAPRTVDHVRVSRANPGGGDADANSLPAVYRDSEGGDSGPGDWRAAPAVQPGTGEEPDQAALTLAATGGLWMRRASEETTWQIGASGEVDWIAGHTRSGMTIAAAIPPIFGAYATVIMPGNHDDKRTCDDALLSVLRGQRSPQPWWLGYLETGVADLVFPDAPRVRLYSGWPYVLVKAGPYEAASWRTNDRATPWHSALPELMFPLDRSWLVSTLWDDDWRCVGGPTGLIEAILRHPWLEAREVALDEDVAPSGHHGG
jgi:hypothetical protein